MRRPSAPTGTETFSGAVKSPLAIARQSVNVSETIRRLQSSNAPGAQQQLNQYLQSLRSRGI